ncbi:hypothetical protein F5Y01DRAFT_288257 [Xylaria sp. FL0043]|nr:hypothetical protein F5Y01DRAFT_288257 [Xylaria sp. FL0043]
MARQSALYLGLLMTSSIDRHSRHSIAGKVLFLIYACIVGPGIVRHWFPDMTLSQRVISDMSSRGVWLVVDITSIAMILRLIRRVLSVAVKKTRRLVSLITGTSWDRHYLHVLCGKGVTVRKPIHLGGMVTRARTGIHNRSASHDRGVAVGKFLSLGSLLPCIGYSWAGFHAGFNLVVKFRSKRRRLCVVADTVWLLAFH